MRLLPLWQPWATLVAIGAKEWETRNRPTPYRGPVAIFACQKWSGDLRALSATTPFAQALAGCDVPRGVIVATAVLNEVLTTEDWMRQYCRRQQPPFPHPTFDRSKAELTFGNYAPDRFAWKLERALKLEKPIPYKARQGFYTLEAEFQKLIAADPAYIAAVQLSGARHRLAVREYELFRDGSGPS